MEERATFHQNMDQSRRAIQASRELLKRLRQPIVARGDPIAASGLADEADATCGQLLMPSVGSRFDCQLWQKNNYP
ncbi:hypothetical protein [Mesorhizobium sp. L103C119B0]|uniref:hypothetical protein n=1 Tax=Mesorhizobium sp. L103C119B0 TaxID=1287085 RepID=UPI0012DCD1B1|nr:hypothetical protein [Mesorhizobium sp. L103C119B0]